MFNKLRAAVIWAKLLNCYNRQDYVKASIYANKYRSISFNNAAFRALDATLDVLNHKSGDAREKFHELASYLKNVPGGDSKYMRLYAEYYLCLIEKNADCEGIRQAAMSTSATKQIRKWLRLPNVQVPT